MNRCSRTLAQDGYILGVSFTSTDAFCLDGRRLLLFAGTYGSAGSEYRTENESFDRIMVVGTTGDGPTSFMVYKNDGLIYEYGNTADSRVQSQGLVSIAAWKLNKVSDRNGNYLTVSYQSDPLAGVALPLRIDYTGNEVAGVAPYNSVRFEYEALPAASIHYVAGAPFVSRSRMTKIAMYVDSTKAWEYRYWYNLPEAQAKEFRLAGTKECSGGGSCLPPTYFYWGSDNATGPVYSTPLPQANDLSPAQGYHNASTSPVALGDFNGDGRTDVARSTGFNTDIYVANGNGFSFYQNFFPRGEPNWVLNGQNLYDRFSNLLPIFAGDWDGDGRTDLARVTLTVGIEFFKSTSSGMQHYTTVPGLGMNNGFNVEGPFPIVTGDWNGDGRTDFARVNGGGIGFYVSTGNGWAGYYSLGDFSPAQGYSESTTYPLLVGDWNGDGLTDIARVSGTSIVFRLSTGSGFGGGFTYNDLSPAQGYSDANAYPILTGDWNGDGITDIGRVSGAGVIFCDSTGTGIGPCRTLNDFSPAQQFSEGTTYPIFEGDFNGDGVTDVARVTAVGVSYYTQKRGSFYGPYLLQDFGVNQGYSNGYVYPIFPGDWNGDGISDLARVTGTGLASYLRTTSAPNVLTNVIDGIGHRIQISYGYLTSSSHYTKGTGAAYPLADMKVPMRIVTWLATWNGVNTGVSWLSYRYTGLRTDLTGRGIAGFEKIDTGDYQTGIKTTTFYRQDFPFKGQPYRKETRQSNGSLLSSKDDTWAVRQFPNGSYFTYIMQTVDLAAELDGSFIKGNTSTFEYDDFGNVTRTVNTTNDGHGEETINMYSNDTSSWLLGLLLQSSTTKTSAGSLPTSRTSAYTYFSTGQVQSETTEPGHPTLALAKNFTRDVFGNIISVAVGGPNVVTRSNSTTFDSRGQFPISTTNALGQSETREFDPRFGTTTLVRDVNGLFHQYSADEFGRPSFEVGPDGVVTRKLYLQATGSVLPNAKYLVRTDTSGLVPSITYYDELHREIRRESVGFGGAKIFVDSEYNDRGNVIRTVDPYFEGTTPLATTYEYDVAGRLVKTTQPGNRVTSTVYNGLSTTVTNPLNQTSVQINDSLGRLVSITDAQNNLLQYRYDGFGNLTQTIDPDGNTTTIGYDVRGHKTQVDDPDTGVSTFGYDALGQIISQTNAKGEAILSTYDKLGRVTTRQNPEGTAHWVYDTAVNGIGKIASISGADGYLERYTYDDLGRVVAVQRTIGGETYGVAQGYDQYSRLAELVYPSGFGIRYLYTALGFPQGIVRSDNGSVIWRTDSINARGQLETQTFGNGLSGTVVYDPNTGFVQQISAGTIQDLRFQFDGLGNLNQRQDAKVSKLENFTYDALNRLTSSQVGGQAAITASYDKLGNLLSRSDVGTYTYGSNGAGPHAVTSISGIKPNTYAYDAAGNRVSSSDGTIAFSSTGKPVSIWHNTHQLTLALDPNDQRVLERRYVGGVLNEIKVMIGSIYERVTRGSSTEEVHYVQGGGSIVAVYTTSSSSSPKTRYVHNDHLGSVQTLSDENGAVVEVNSFDSWGNRRNPTTWDPATASITSEIDRGFTGHEHLESVSLIHMNGRVYDPVIGRFVSADPFVQAPKNLQNLNRYSYVLNNPLSLTDPSGYLFGGLFKSIGKFLKKALPIVVSIVAAYYGAPIFSEFFNVGCYAGFQGVLASGLSAAATGFTASVPAALIGGDSLSNALRAGLRGGAISGLWGSASLGLDDAFPGWSKSITGVKMDLAKGHLEILRADDAVARQIFGMGVRSTVRGAIAEAFGGSFKKSFFTSLGANSYSWAVSALSEAEFVTEWEQAAQTHRLNCADVLNTPEKVKNLLVHFDPSMRTAAHASDQTMKDWLGISVINPFENNHGVAGSAHSIVGERGALNNFIGMNVPGEQSVSIAHDLLVGQFQRTLGGGVGPLTSAYSTIMIPPAVASVQWAAGYRDAAETSYLARRR